MMFIYSVICLSQLYKRSPRIRLASWMSCGKIVTLLACMAAKFALSRRLTRYAANIRRELIMSGNG